MTTQARTTLFKKINPFEVDLFQSDFFRTTFFKRVRRIPPIPVALGLAYILTVILMETVLAAGATFTVTNTNDSGSGSLRWAIEQANANGNPTEVDTINFNISGAAHHLPYLATADHRGTGEHQRVHAG